MLHAGRSRPQTADRRPPTHDGPLRRSVSERPLEAEEDVLKWRPAERAKSAQDLCESDQLFDSHGRVNLPPSQLEMPPPTSTDDDGDECDGGGAAGPGAEAPPPAGSPSSAAGRPSSAQLKLAVARGMAAVAEAGMHSGESQDNILVGMRFAGRLMAEQAVKDAMEDDSRSMEDIEGLSQKVEGYIADMMSAGQRLSSAGDPHAQPSPMAAADTAGTGSGSSGAALDSIVTLSSSSDDDEEEEEMEEGDDDEWARGDDPGRLATTPLSASSLVAAPFHAHSPSPAWEVRGVMEAWTEHCDMAATVGAAIGSFCQASSSILDHMQACLEDGAAAAAALPAGWNTQDSCGAGELGPTSPVQAASSKGGNKRKGSAGRRKAAAAIQEGVKLVATHQGEFRCAAVCGDRVWLADRGGRIEIRSRAPKFSTAGGKVSKVPAVLHCIPAELDNLVWCLLPVGKHQMWVGQEVGPIRVYNTRSYEKVAEVPWHQGGVTCMVSTSMRGNSATAAAQRRVFTGSLDFSICCWHAKSLKKEAVMTGHSNGVRCLLVVGSTLWSGSDDCTIRVWDILSLGSAPECLSALEGHRGGVLSLVVAGQGVWSGSEDGTIREWSVTGSRTCLRQVTETDRISTLVPMGLNHVWACGQEPSVTIWDTHTMQPVHRLAGHLSWVNMLVKVEHTETRMLWSASMSDKSLRVWQHKNSIDTGDVLNINELTAANEVLSDEAAGLRRRLDAARTMSETAQDAAVEVTKAANWHLEHLQAVAEEATKKSADTEAELEDLRRRVAELDQAVSEGLDREEALHQELDAERHEASRLRARAREERSVNADLRGDKEALLAETERLQDDKDAIQAELAHVRTTLRIMQATAHGPQGAGSNGVSDSSSGTSEDASSAGCSGTAEAAGEFDADSPPEPSRDVQAALNETPSAEADQHSGVNDADDLAMISSDDIDSVDDDHEELEEENLPLLIVDDELQLIASSTSITSSMREKEMQAPDPAGNGNGLLDPTSDSGASITANCPSESKIVAHGMQHDDDDDPD